jgi:5'-3' exonuclease
LLTRDVGDERATVDAAGDGKLGPVNAKAERLMLLDAPSLYFRAFFGVPQTWVAADGMPVNAVKGLLEFLAHLVTVRRPTHLVACMDADWRPAWRVAAVPSYKTHRVATGLSEAVPDPLSRQVPLICAVLDALGVTWIGAANYEADDVIATLAARSTRPVDVVTGDRDLFQVIDDARGVRVLYTAKGVARHEVVDESAVTARYGIPGRAYADFALLRGDPSDGLPGVRGVGDKTAAALISRYGSITGVLGAAADPASGMRRDLSRKVIAAQDYLIAAYPVVRVATDVPVGVLDDRLPSTPRDPTTLVALAEGLRLEASFDRVLLAMAGRA